MTIPLAKTSAPSVASAVARERLFKRLDAASRRPIVWVSGPPGAGKTTLVASYVAVRRLRCVWYRVDAGDADLASFFFYLARAASEGRRARRRPLKLPLLTPEYRGGEAAFARRFFRDLVSTVGPCLLVFDDVTAAGVPVCSALRHGLEELGPGTRAALISREDPTPEFARLIAGGSMAHLSGADLRLARTEALAVARLHAARGTTAADLARICEGADGWAAGVVLLASAGAGARHAEPSRRALFDYLASEVFDRESPEVRDVLIDAAVVAPIPVRLADRICGSERAGAILGELAEKAYFTRLHGADSAFDLHPLFRDFLLARALTERQADDLRRLRARAGALLADEGHGEHALALLLDAQAWAEAARVAIGRAPSLVAAGRSATLERWLRAIPAAERERDPWIGYWLAVSLLASDADRARGLLERAFAGFEAAGDVHGLYASCVAALEATVLEWSDFSAMDPWIERVEALDARGLAVPSGELQLRLTVASFAALTFHRMESAELPVWEARALQTIREETTPLPLRLTLGSWFLVESAMRGEILRCREVIEALAPLARAPGADPAPVVGWLSAESVYHWHSGAPTAAAETVGAGLDLGRRSGVHVWDFLLHLQGVNAALAADDHGRARMFLAAATRSFEPKRLLHLAVLAHERGLVALRGGDLEGVTESGRATTALGERGAMPFFTFIGPAMLALAAMRRGDAAAARPHLETARRVGARLRTSLAEFLCELCEADLARRAGEVAAAREHLARGFRVAREKGVTPDVWFSREQMADLCALALELGIEPQLVRALVRRLELAPPRSAEELDAWPWPVRVRLLGALEVEIDDRPLGDRAASQRRPLAVLAAIAAASGGRGVAEHVVEDALWPESDGAHHALETSLYRLRRLLGEGAVRCSDRMLSIDPRRCWVDAVALEAVLARARGTLRAGDAEGTLRAVDRVVRLYRGPFLAERDEPWVLSARNRLRRGWGRILAEVGNLGADRPEIRSLLARAVEADPALDAARSPASNEVGS